MEKLKKLIGSLLIVGFEGTSLTASCRNFLEQWDLGGVILFKRNIESLEQLSRLNQSIYQAADLPPILSVDHEGGRVFRLPAPFTVFPPMGVVGEYCQDKQDGAMAFKVGEALGAELKAVGFNVDWAPVLDVHSNPQNPIIGDRAFSQDPQYAAKWALEFWRGLESTGVVGCAKHFPGHGDTLEDSHKTLPQVDKSLAELKAVEFLPFQQAAEQKVPMMMSAHVLYPSLDPEWPATLSKKILTDLLRGEMAYEGLIVSDDMFMQGIAARWPLEEAAELFFRAGGDLLLLCHQEAYQRRVAAHLVHTAEKDKAFRTLLEERAARMKAFRARLSLGLANVGADSLGFFAALQTKHQNLVATLAGNNSLKT